MGRIHDLGGMEGFGPVEPGDDDPPFHADWEARVYALSAALLRKGTFGLDEMRDAIERLPPDAYLSMSYYERRFVAVCHLLVDKGVLDPADLDAAASDSVGLDAAGG